MSEVLVDRQGALAIVTLNRPTRRNGMTLALAVSLYDALQGVAASDTRVVILRGAGNDFCVGADFGALEEGAQTGPRPLGTDERAPVYHASLLLHTMPQVTIAAIDGGCAGAGMGWAAGCDLRFASEEARLSTAFLNVAASGDMGTCWSLTRIVGGARARDMLFFPQKLTGSDALALGFVSRIFPRAEFHGEVEKLAQQLCERDPMALAMMKANAVSAETLPMADYIAIETERHLRCFSRPDAGASMAEMFAKSRGQ